ncbi:MAG: InlB B-repeat-containing protein [Paludibacteraceae bacterium]|nr:InlB B-repeat-containing protein [Paludibacteraceae bacterium]
MKHLKFYLALLMLVNIGISSVQATDPAVDDVIFKEEFTVSSATKANVYNFAGTTTWSGSKTGLSYVSSNTSSELQTTTANPITTANFFFVKTAASSLTMSGIAIPANVTEVTISFLSNKTIVTCDYSFTGSNYQRGVTSVNGTATFDLDVTNQSSLYLQFNKSGTSSNARIDDVTIKVKTIGSAEPGVSLDYIAITGTPSKTYEQGQSFDPTGLTVTAYYDDETDADVTGNVEWSFNPATFTVAGENKSVTATATYQEKEASETYNDITVTAHVVTAGTHNVTLNNALFGSEAAGSLSGDALHDYTGQQNDITFNYVKGLGSNMYMNASQIRLYKNITLVVSVPAGFNITEVTGLVANIAANNGSISNNTWTGKSNSITFSFTASSGNAQLGAISVTYEAVAPEVTVDPSSLSFDAKQNIAVDGKTFTLTGANLTSGLTLAASAGFNVSLESITAADAMAQGGVEVTVTPATPTATTTPVEGTVTISGGGLTSDVVVNLSMAVTPTYLVAIAVNDGDMGSATLNGGTASIYVTDDEEIALVATPESGHEFVNWTVSDDDIVLDDKNAASTTAMAGAAGTITANFQAQACTGLAAPVLDDVTTTYQSATIAWETVANADGYVLNIKKHEGNVAVVTDELIVAPTVSFEKTGLAANTQYDYSVMAVGDGTAYCDESNPTLAGSFTTNDYPSVAVTYSENNNSVSGGSKKIMTPFALPDEVTNEISGKTFVGWTTKSDFEDGDKSDEETYFAKGANFTIQSNAAVTLYAVYATAAGGAGSTWVINKDNFSTVSTGSGYAPYNGDHTEDDITYNTNQVMLQSQKVQFQKNNGVMYNKTAFDADIVSIAIDGIDANITVYEGAEEISTGGTSITLADGVYPFSSGKRYFRIQMGNATGTATSITVNLAGATSYSDYVISGSAALPVLGAPTGLTAGTYYEAQTITLAATNDADIYYTEDGSEPTTSSTKYTAPFTVDATKTIKAIAAKEGFENSPVAEATYTFGTVFASVSALYTYLTENDNPTNLNNVKVTGLVSRVTAAWDGSKLTYYISDNGKAENDLQMYRGVGLEADQVKVGDQVTVTGNYVLYNSNIHEFAAGNTIVARTAGAHASYEMVGDLTQDQFEDGATFADSYMANLKVNDVYNTGYKAEVDGVTFTANKTTLAVADETIHITATKDEETLAEKDFEIHVSAAYMVSFELKAGYKTEYFVGQTFVKPTVVATLSDNSHVEAEATECTGYNMNEANTYDVTVSFTYGAITINDVQYQITVKTIANDLATAYTASVAKDIIENVYASTTESTYDVYVSGKVIADANNSGTYFISDDGTDANKVQIYQGKYFDSSVSAKSNVKAGDEVVVKGHILVYSNAAEMKATTVISQFRTPEFTFADIVEGDEFEANISEDLAVVPTANSGDAEFTLTSGNTDVVTIVDGKLHAVAEGDAVITATRAATANENALNYKKATTTFNVHVIAERDRYTVSFDADGGTGTDPVIANQLPGATVDLPENPYSKESSAFVGWVVNDGAVEITDGQFTMPEGNVTIKATWNVVATCAISFMVNGAEVATANAPQTAEFSLAGVSHPTVPGFTWEGWSETEQAEEVENAPAMITTYTPEAGEATKVLYGIYSRLDNSSASYGNYIKATVVAEGDYLIVCENQNVAFDGSLTTLDAVSNTQAVAISEGILTLTNADNYVFTIAAKQGGYSIKSASDKYIGQGSDANGLASAATDNYTNSISITDGDVDIASSSAHLRYNKANNQTRFRYFKSSSYSGQEAIQLYKKDNGVTYYTSSPVEKVTITFDANGGEGGCQNAIINKGSQLTICAEAPTKSHSEFAGWKNGDDVYVAGQAYTFDADITLTAQWDAAATYTVTYVANGANGDVPTEVAQYAGDEFTIAAAGELEKAGYTFAGWEYNNTIYAAGENFTMPAENVVLTAQWKNEALYKMHLLTSTAEMVSGMKVVLAYQDSEDESKNALNADITGTNKYISVSGDNVAFNSEENTVTYGAGVVVLIADKVTNGWTLRKDNTNYLQETSVKNLAWNTKDNATVWTINFDGNNAVIANSTNEENKLQYNSSNPRFLTYASQQKQIMLYGEMAVVNDNADITDLGNVDGEVIVVEEGMTLTVDEEANPATVIVKNGSTLDMSAQLNANNLIIETKGGQSAQITNVNNLNVSGDIYMDITLCDGSVDADYWYCISAPFNIDAANGFYLVDGTKLTQGVDYIIRTYDGQQRANTGKGWNKGVGNTLYAGKAYLIGFNPGQPNILRVKAANSAFAAVTSMTLNEYSAGEDADKNWNAVGNPNYNYVSINQDAHVYDNTNHAFVVYSYNQYTFVVGTPMFIQFAGTLNLGTTDHGQYRAPRMDNKISACVRISREDATRFDNQLYIRASEEATNGFDYGHDLVTMNETTSNTAALIWTENYGKRLAIEEAPMDEQIDYALGISAPAAGTYTLQQVGDVENAEVYLTYEGQIIWNLSKSAYSLDLGKGANSGYGLRLIIGRNNVVTGLDEMGSDTDNTQKVILNGNLFILRDGKLFNATGSQVK